MKAWVFEAPGRITPAEVPTPKLREPDELLVRTSHCGICFTDKHFFSGLRPLPVGTILGHEASAEVVEVGPAVADLKVGDLVAIDPRLCCGTCMSCRAGSPGLCEEYATDLYRTIGVGARYRGSEDAIPGFFAEFSVVPERNCIPLPSSVSALAGAAVESLSVGLRSVTLGRVAPSDAVVFFGFEDYAIGAFYQLPLCHRIVVEPIPARRQLAVRLGADLVIDPTKDDAIRLIVNECPDGADAAFVAMEAYVALSARYLVMAAEAVRPRGLVAILRQHFFAPIEGLDRRYQTFKKEIRIENFGQFWQGQQLRGGHCRGEIAAVVDQLRTGKFDARAHISRVADYSAIRDAADVTELFDLLPMGESKIVVRFT